MFTFQDCHTINANREIVSWVSETLDLLYPDWTPPQSAKSVTPSEVSSHEEKVIGGEANDGTQQNIKDDEKKNEHDEEFDEEFDEDEDDEDDSDDETENNGISLFSSSVTKSTKRRKLSHSLNESQQLSTPLEQQSSSSQMPENKDELKKKHNKRAFDVSSRVLQLDVGLRGVGFAQVLDPQVDIGRVHEHMLRTQLMEQKIVKSRYVIRLLPIYSSCFSSIETLTKLASTFVPEFFNLMPPGTSLSTIIERRTKNDAMDRDLIMKACASSLPTTNDLKIEYKNPDVCIIVQLVGRATYLGFCRNYMELKKCNVQALAEAAMTENAQANKSEKVAAQLEIEKQFAQTQNNAE